MGVREGLTLTRATVRRDCAMHAPSSSMRSSTALRTLGCSACGWHLFEYQVWQRPQPHKVSGLARGEGNGDQGEISVDGWDQSGHCIP